MIYSVNQLKDWPNFDELNEVTYWMYEVSTMERILYAIIYVNTKIHILSYKIRILAFTKIVLDQRFLEMIAPIITLANIFFIFKFFRAKLLCTCIFAHLLKEAISK